MLCPAGCIILRRQTRGLKLFLLVANGVDKVSASDQVCKYFVDMCKISQAAHYISRKGSPVPDLDPPD